MRSPSAQAAYRHVRSTTDRLCAPLSSEDAAVQSMPDASPAKWHLAHTTWFFETFILEAVEPDYEPYRAEFRELFNSYYHGVGLQHPRDRRGLLTRPSLEEVRDYRAHVDEKMSVWLEDPGALGELAARVEIGLHHEQQHQELLLTDVKHLFGCNPLAPAYTETPRPERSSVKPLHWLGREAGVREIGHAGPGYAFDNESPRHRVFVQDFELASRPATNEEFMGFIQDRGYERYELWLADGWDLVQREGWRAPLYWREREGRWSTFTLGGLREVRAEDPVCHLSFYEADAFARWMCARLPSEAEWETVAEERAIEGNFLESGLLHPCVAAVDRAGSEVRQMFGDVWEWTRSAYAPYPGFSPTSGALGEYNGKFMSSQMVLRGGSCVSPRSHLRPSYRNFFYPSARWQFSGVRLARDGSA